MLKILRNIVGLLLLQVLTGCAVTHNFGPYIGKVLDAKTQKPIEGAVVYMSCYTQSASPAGAISHFADFKEVLSDEKGRFHLEHRVNTFRVGHLWDKHPRVYVFKPGYGVFPSHQAANVDIKHKDSPYLFPQNTPVDIYLPKLSVIDERLRNLSHIYIPLEVPLKKGENIFRLENIERLNVGLKPKRLKN